MEVEANLKSRGVYLSGERLECELIFTNVGRLKPRKITDTHERVGFNGSRSANLEKHSKITRENSLQNCQPEHLAWASVQIQCLCQWIDSSGKGANKKPAALSNTNQELGTGTSVADHKRSTTSLHIGISDNLKQKGGIAGENIQELSCTRPKILFCDIDLLPGECQIFSYDETIPSGCPSTYHGKNIRYYYRLVVAAQRVGCPIATLRLPIRVLSPFNHVSVLGQKKDFPNEDRNGFGYQDDRCGRGQMGIFGGNNKPAIANPFASHSEGSDFGSDDLPGHHEDEEDPDGLLSSKLALLLHDPAPIAAARRKATHYDIRATKGLRVGKLCLFKTAYKLGEDILGLFDFSQVDLSCLQYSVSLIGEEKIPSENDNSEKTHPKRTNSDNNSPREESEKDKLEETTSITYITKLVSKQSHQEFCFGFEETSFALAVPLHVTPSFKFPECQLSWALRFEFVISSTRSDSTELPKVEPIIKCQPYIGEDVQDDLTSMGHEWNGPSKVEVETMTWNLPIILLPAHPQIVSSAIPLTLKCSMTM